MADHGKHKKRSLFSSMVGVIMGTNKKAKVSKPKPKPKPKPKKKDKKKMKKTVGGFADLLRSRGKL